MDAQQLIGGYAAYTTPQDLTASSSAEDPRSATIITISIAGTIVETYDHGC